MSKNNKDNKSNKKISKADSKSKTSITSSDSMVSNTHSEHGSANANNKANSHRETSSSQSTVQTTSNHNNTSTAVPSQNYNNSAVRPQESTVTTPYQAMQNKDKSDSPYKKHYASTSSSAVSQGSAKANNTANSHSGTSSSQSTVQTTSNHNNTSTAVPSQNYNNSAARPQESTVTTPYQAMQNKDKSDSPYKKHYASTSSSAVGHGNVNANNTANSKSTARSRFNRQNVNTSSHQNFSVNARSRFSQTNTYTYQKNYSSTGSSAVRNRNTATNNRPFQGSVKSNTPYRTAARSNISGTSNTQTARNPYSTSASPQRQTVSSRNASSTSTLPNNNAVAQSKRRFSVVRNAVHKTGLVFGMLSPNRQIELRRVVQPDGKVRITGRVVRNDDLALRNDGRFHGVLNAAYNYGSTRFRGDTFSVTKRLNALKPKSTLGIVGVSTLKGSYRAVRTTNRTVGISVLTAERAAVAASRHAVGAFVRKTESELSQTDTGRAVLKVRSLQRFIHSQNHTMSLYRSQKKRLRLREQDLKLSKKTIDPKLKEAKRKLKTEKEIFTKQKASLSKSRSPVKKQMLKKRKAQYKGSRKELKQYRRTGKSINRAYRKRLKAENTIARLTGTSRLKIGIPFTPLKVKVIESPLALKRRTVNLAKGISAAALSSYTNKLLQADPQNDTLAAIDRSVNVAKRANAAVQSVRLRNARRAANADRAVNKRKNKLKKQENKLHEKKTQPLHKKKKYRRKKNESFSNAVKRYIDGIVASAGTAAKSVFKEFLMFLLPIVSFVLCIGIVFFMVFSVFSDATHFVMGTYTASDQDLTEAVEVYTWYANNFHTAIYNMKDQWKNSLKSLGVDTTSGYKHKPYEEDFIFGRCDYYEYDPAEYDFDPYILWSFLCAYNYDFEKSADLKKQGKTYAPEYWKVDDDTEDLLKQLFYEEYTFEHEYIDKSDWSELPPQFYQKLSNNVKVYWNEFHTNTIKIENESSLPYQIKNYVKDGWLHYDYYSLEILNANNNNEETGWFLQDYLSDISSPGIWSSGIGTGNEIWYAVPPWDTKIDNIAYIRFVKKKVFNTDATLYYNILKKCTFKEAAEKLLKDKNSMYAAAAVDYFNMLLGDDRANYHGNHQCMTSPVKDNMQQLIENNRIYNGYGYDKIEHWDQKHCNNYPFSHNGIDIACTSGEQIYSMISGKVTDVSDNSVTILAKDFELIYSSGDGKKNRKYNIEVVIKNINPTVEKGNFVKVGETIGTANTTLKCTYDNFNYWNNYKNYNCYIHISAYIEKLVGKGLYIDPELLIY